VITTELSDKELSAVGIICLTVLEGLAMILGIDGAMLALVIAVIAGIAGFNIQKLRSGE
jgi:hypothetical protein